MGDRLFSWFDVTGIEYPLNGETNYLAIVGPSGLYGIPVSFVTQDVPLQPGTTEKYVQLAPGKPSLPVAIYADSEDSLDVARRALRYAMQANRGLGILQHTANDGTIRQLNCRLASGFAELAETGSNRAGGLIIANLVFFASDPYWYDVNFTQQLFSISAGAGLFDSPAILPIKLAPSGVAGSASVDNTGDAEAWPIWVLSGPCTGATFTNNTTGDALTLTVTLTAGQSVTIDTTPGNKTVTREDASKHFSYLSSTSLLWSLAQGINSINVNVTGPGTGTQVTLSYKQRYEGV